MIKHNGMVFDKSRLIEPSHVKTIGDSNLLYNHKMIYVTEGMKSTDIDLNNILLDAYQNITTTIVMDINLYTMHFLNRLLKPHHEHKLVRYSICGKNPRDYVSFCANKIQVGITILNLNYCKQSFKDKSDGVGIKIKIYQSSNDDIINIYEIFSCLYSKTYTDLHFIDGIDIVSPQIHFSKELEKADKFIKVQKKYMEKNKSNVEKENKNKYLKKKSKPAPLSEYATHFLKCYGNDTSDYTISYTTSSN